jgi:hypothetical protein
VTKLGGLIGAVLGFLLPFAVVGRIDVLADDTSTWSDYAGTAVGIAFAVGGWVLGSRVVGWLKARYGRSRSLAQ